MKRSVMLIFFLEIDKPVLTNAGFACYFQIVLWKYTYLFIYFMKL